MLGLLRFLTDAGLIVAVWHLLNAINRMGRRVDILQEQVRDRHKQGGAVVLGNSNELYPGSLGYRDLRDGRVLVLQPAMYGAVNLHLGQQGDVGFTHEWTYPRRAVDVAYDALRTFDGEGDPAPGWVRAYPPYFRRRDDGDPASEEVRP